MLPDFAANLSACICYVLSNGQCQPRRPHKKRILYKKECRLSRYYFQRNILIFVQFTYAIFFFGNFTFFNSRNIERCDTCYTVHNTTPLAFSYIGNANKEAQLPDLHNHTITMRILRLAFLTPSNHPSIQICGTYL